jgi:phosphoribosylanthranilate isomerase
MSVVSVRTKICGVTTPADAAFAVEHGADAVGLNFYAKSPRYLTPVAAATIVRGLPAFACPVGVFVNEPLRRATAIAFQLGLRAIQTVDDVPQANEAFPFAYVPAFRVKDGADLAAITAFCQAAKPAAVLIDSHVIGQKGGTGVTAPWHLLAGFDPGVPVLLAGGLTADNVAEAIRVVRPWGVDVASGVESSPGVKDSGKVRAFLSAVRAGS